MAAEMKTPEAKPWRATVLTLFPEMFPGPLGVSLAGKALASGLWALEARDIRDSATDRHRSVDDTPAGGGPGMVLRADVLAAAIDAAECSRAGPPAPPDEPAGSAIDPVAGRGTRRRARPADRLRPVRGRRPAGHRGPRARGGFDRRLRAVGRRNRRHGADRRLRPAAAGGDGKARFRGRGELFRRTTGIPAIYPPAGVRGPADPGNPDFRRPRQGRGLAAGRGRGPDPGAAARSLGRQASPRAAKNAQKTRRKGDNAAAFAVYERQIRAMAG